MSCEREKNSFVTHILFLVISLGNQLLILELLITILITVMNTGFYKHIQLLRLISFRPPLKKKKNSWSGDQNVCLTKCEVCLILAKANSFLVLTEVKFLF